jgi:hypothetical protein
MHINHFIHACIAKRYLQGHYKQRRSYSLELGSQDPTDNMIFVGTAVKKNNEDPDRKNEGPQSDAFEALTNQFLLSYLSPDLLEIIHRFTNPQSAIFITALHSVPRAGLFLSSKGGLQQSRSSAFFHFNQAKVNENFHILIYDADLKSGGSG